MITNDRERKEQLLERWTEEVQLLPEGYRPIPELISRGRFAVAAGENPGARPGERYSVAAARTAVLEGKSNPLPGEPFTSHYSRRRFAEGEFERLVGELG